jgi:hypothetical protein
MNNLRPLVPFNRQYTGSRIKRYRKYQTVFIGCVVVFKITGRSEKNKKISD